MLVDAETKALLRDLIIELRKVRETLGDLPLVDWNKAKLCECGHPRHPGMRCGVDRPTLGPCPCCASKR